MSVCREHRWLLLAVCAAQFFMPFMMAGVNAVLPAISLSLDASARELGLIGAFYALGLAVFQLAGGLWGDIWGRRRIFLVGLAIFSLSGALLGFVENMTLFLFLRLGRPYRFMEAVGDLLVLQPLCAFLGYFPLARG